MATAISAILSLANLGANRRGQEVPPPRSQGALNRSTVLACDLEDRGAIELALGGERLLAVEPGQDAIGAITTWLKANPSNELNLVAHGAPGQIALGAGIDRSGLLERAELLGSWGVKQINLWSCRVGADQAFIATLEELSGARVVAGADALGKGKTLVGSNFAALEEVVMGLAGELVEVGNTTDTASTIAVNASIFNTIDSIGDHDWFKISLIQGSNYKFNVDGNPAYGAIRDPINYGNATLSDSYLYLRDINGELITKLVV